LRESFKVAPAGYARGEKHAEKSGCAGKTAEPDCTCLCRTFCAVSPEPRGRHAARAKSRKYPIRRSSSTQGDKSGAGTVFSSRALRMREVRRGGAEVLLREYRYGDFSAPSKKARPAGRCRSGRVEASRAACCSPLRFSYAQRDAISCLGARGDACALRGKLAKREKKGPRNASCSARTRRVYASLRLARAVSRRANHPARAGGRKLAVQATPQARRIARRPNA